MLSLNIYPVRGGSIGRSFVFESFGGGQAAAGFCAARERGEHNFLPLWLLPSPPPPPPPPRQRDA